MIGGALGELIIRIGADATALNRELAKSSSRVDEFAGRMVSAGTRIAAFGGIVAGAMLAAASAVDDAFDTLRIGTGATGAALQQLQGDFNAVALAVPSSLGQTATAVSELSRRTGASGAALQGLSTQVLNLSRITGTDLNANVRNSARLFGDWKIATDAQAGTLDFLFRASQATGIGVDQLAASVVRFGAPLRQMGFSFQQAAALIASFEREGVNADAVLGSLRRGLATFTKAGLDAPAALQTVIRKMQELGPGAEATSLALKVFGTRAGPDMAAAILEGRLEIDKLLTQLTASSETINGAAEETADFAESMAVLRNRAVLAFGALAAPALPAFTALANSAIGVVQTLADAFAAVPSPARNTLVTLTLLTTAVGAAVAAVGLLTRALVALNAAMGLSALAGTIRGFVALTPAVYAASGAMGVLRFSFTTLKAAMGPIGWITIVIGALAGLGLAFRRAGKEARDAAAAAAEGLEKLRSELQTMGQNEVTTRLLTNLDQQTALRQQLAAGRELLAMRERLNREGRATTETVEDGLGRVTVRESAFGAELRRARQNMIDLRQRQEELLAQQKVISDVGSEIMERNAPLLDMPDLPDVDLSGLEDATAATSRLTEKLDLLAGGIARVRGELKALGNEARARIDVTATAEGKFGSGAAGLSAAVLSVPGAISAAAATLKIEAEGFADTIANKLRQGAESLKEQSVRAVQSAQQASEQLRQSIAGAFTGIMPGVLGDFARTFGQIAKTREAGGDTGGIAPFPGAATFALAMETLAPLFSALAVPLQALTQPLTIFGTILGQAIVPVLQALFPVVKAIAIIFTYAGQVIGNVVGALATVLGAIIAAIGNLISKIPGLGQEGGAIERFGKGLQRFGDSMFDLAGAMVGARDKIKGLTWDEAITNVDNLGDAAGRAATALVNAVDGFKIARYRFDAVSVQPGSPAPKPPPTAPPGGPSGGGTRPTPATPANVTMPINFYSTGNAVADYAALYAQAERASLSDPAARAGFLQTWPRPA